MKDRILNKIIEFCIERVSYVYNPYFIIATINPNRTKMIIKELEEHSITNKKDYLKWREDFKKEFDK